MNAEKPKPEPQREEPERKPTNVVRLPPPRYRVEDTNPGD